MAENIAMDEMPQKRVKLVKPKTIWMDEETISMWEKLETPAGGYFDVPAIVRDAIKKRLKEIAENTKEAI